MRKRGVPQGTPRYNARSLETMGLTFLSLRNGELKVKDESGATRTYRACYPGCPDTGRVRVATIDYYFVGSSYPPLRNK